MPLTTLSITLRLKLIKDYTLAFFSFLLVLNALTLLFLDVFNVGTIIPLLLGSLGLILFKYRQARQKWLLYRPIYRLIYTVYRVGLCIWLISLMLFFSWVIQPNTVATVSPNVILILGSGLKNNQPTPTLKARLDTGLIEARRLPSANILLTGGIGINQIKSEAAVMADYLIMRGIEPSRILLEERSTSTYENLVFSKALLPDIDPLFTRIIIVSSDFHLPRAKAIAYQLNLPIVSTVGASTPLLIRYNARLREYFAFIKSGLLNEF
ncbi:MAG: hypothetical protein RI956_1026 [Pseudomonadota bacterium]